MVVEIDLIFVILAEYLRQRADFSRYKIKFSKSRRGHFLIKQIETMPRKSTYNFTEPVNINELKQGTVCQIVRFISHFSLRGPLWKNQLYLSFFMKQTETMPRKSTF